MSGVPCGRRAADRLTVRRSSDGSRAALVGGRGAGDATEVADLVNQESLLAKPVDCG